MHQTEPDLKILSVRRTPGEEANPAMSVEENKAVAARQLGAGAR
jgi:hypothetical protein